MEEKLRKRKRGLCALAAHSAESATLGPPSGPPLQSESQRFIAAAAFFSFHGVTAHSSRIRCA